MATSEMRGFVFSLIFIIIFATLLSTIPAGLQGPEETPEGIVPISPSLLTGFNAHENWTKAACTLGVYEYTLGERDWVFGEIDDTIIIAKKIKILDWLWFGEVDTCKFISSDGVNRGDELTFTEIETDAEDGSERYEMQFTESGDVAGGFVVYWNTTIYSDPVDAWDNNLLHVLHGVGFDASATTNIGALIVGLLTLQLPDVPVLVNMFLAVPVWACIIYVFWYIIKEMIPFL